MTDIYPMCRRVEMKIQTLRSASGVYPEKSRVAPHVPQCIYYVGPDWAQSIYAHTSAESY